MGRSRCGLNCIQFSVDGMHAIVPAARTQRRQTRGNPPVGAADRALLVYNIARTMKQADAGQPSGQLGGRGVVCALLGGAADELTGSR